MNVMQETAFYGLSRGTADGYVGLAILEDGTWLLVHKDGTAVDGSGKRYARVSQEVESQPIPADKFMPFYCDRPEDMDKEPPETFPIPDTDLTTVGWTTEADKSIVLPLQ